MKIKTHIQIYCVRIISQFRGEKQLGNQTEGFSDLVCSLPGPQWEQIFALHSEEGFVHAQTALAHGNWRPQMSASISQMVFPCSPLKIGTSDQLIHTWAQKVSL